MEGWSEARTGPVRCRRAVDHETDFKILTETTKTPPRAVALASFLGDSFAAIGARAPPAKDLMAFGSVLQHNQHNIGA